jgi:DNA invertase Pin-like site-specific DNA recombinase
MHATGTKSIAIYARSAAAFGQAQTLERQVQQARALIARQFGDPVEVLVFTDGTAGESIGNRPGLVAMMQAAESGRIQQIVTGDASRISRSNIELTTIVGMLCNRNIPFTSID